MSVNNLSPVAMSVYTASPASGDSVQGATPAFRYSNQLFSAMEKMTSIPAADRNAVIGVIAENAKSRTLSGELSLPDVQGQHLSKAYNMYANMLNKLGYLDKFDPKKQYLWKDLSAAVKKFKEDMKKLNIELNIDPADEKLSPRLQTELLRMYAAKADSELIQKARESSQDKRLFDSMGDTAADYARYLENITSIAEGQDTAMLEKVKEHPEFKNPSPETLKQFGEALSGSGMLGMLGVTAEQLWKANNATIQGWARAKGFEMKQEFFNALPDLKAGIFLKANPDIAHRFRFELGGDSSLTQAAGRHMTPQICKRLLADAIQQTISSINSDQNFDPQNAQTQDKNVLRNVRGMILIADSIDDKLAETLTSYLKEMAKEEEFKGLGLKVDEDSGNISIDGVGDISVAAVSLPQGRGIENAEQPMYKDIGGLWSQVRDLTNMPQARPVPITDIPGGLASGDAFADISVRVMIEAEPGRYDQVFISALLDFKGAYMPGHERDAGLDSATKAEIAKQHRLLFEAEGSEYERIKDTIAGLPEGKSPISIEPSDAKAIEEGKLEIRVYWGTEKTGGSERMCYFAVAHDALGGSQVLSSMQQGSEQFYQESAALSSVQAMIAEKEPQLDRNRNKTGYVNDGFLDNLLNYYVKSGDYIRGAYAGQPDSESRKSEEASRIIARSSVSGNNPSENVLQMIGQLIPLMGSRGSGQALPLLSLLFSKKADMKGLGRREDSRYFRSAAVEQAVLVTRALVDMYNGREIRRLFTASEDGLETADRQKKMQIEALGAKTIREAAAAMPEAVEREKFEQEALRAFEMVLKGIAGAFEVECGSDATNADINKKMDSMLLDLANLIRLRGEEDEKIKDFSTALNHILGYNSIVIDSEFIKGFSGDSK